MAVTFGPAGQEEQYPCDLKHVNDTTISCYTSRAEGQALQFRVVVGPGSHAQAAVGTDTYRCPELPVVREVKGCGPECPTSGRVGGSQVQ